MHDKKIKEALNLDLMLFEILGTNISYFLYSAAVVNSIA
jgi:hypothetical protein